MFSYFSSSDVDGVIDSAKSNEGVTAAGTLVTEQSNISNDECGLKEIPAVGNVSSTHFKSAPAAATSWNQAHDLYCTKHGTLKATIQQVLSETCEENQEIPWELPRRSNVNVLVEAKEVADFLQTKREKSTVATTPQKSSASSWLMSPLKIVSAVASIMRDPDDEIDEWIQEGDDAFIDEDDNYSAEPSSSSSSSTALELNTPIINLDMTESAIQCLENEIGHLPPDMPHVLGLSEWNYWAHSSLAKDNTNNNFHFSVHDKDFLLQVLVDLNRARIIQRENCEPKGLDVVVLSSKTLTTGNDDRIPDNFHIPIYLWDIQKAEEKIEQKLQEWSEQAAECTKKALQYKKRNQIKIAATQLTKRNLIQKRIDSDSRLQMQLLQIKNAIESAQSNRSMIDLMADSTKLLRQLREQTPLEEIDETIDDLQSEIDGLQDINDTISSIGKNVTNMGTDEELLEELQNLSINENVPVTSTTADTSTFTTRKKDVKVSKIEKIVVSEEIQSDSFFTAQKEPELA
jgi:CO dehydrogenase/acetyl-CoA synthase epsilon subunit